MDTLVPDQYCPHNNKYLRKTIYLWRERSKCFKCSLFLHIRFELWQVGVHSSHHYFKKKKKKNLQCTLKCLTGHADCDGRLRVDGTPNNGAFTQRKCIQQKCQENRIQQKSAVGSATSLLTKLAHIRKSWFVSTDSSTLDACRTAETQKAQSFIEKKTKKKNKCVHLREHASTKANTWVPQKERWWPVQSCWQ